MPAPIRLFQIGQRGVDLVNKPQDLDEAELVAGQNCEVSTSGGGGALDQRPGMTRIGNTPVSGAVIMALDISSQLLTDLTPWLYAGLYSTAVHNWRKSSDGVTWSNDDGLAKPFSNNANITLYAKNYPRAVTVGSKLYWMDANAPVQVHAWDGTTDTVVSTIPSAVVGVTLTTPTGNTWQSQGSAGAASYTYKVVATNGSSHSAASPAIVLASQSATLGDGTGGTVYNYFGGTPVAGATAYDIYRTAGGPSQGKIGTAPIISGHFVTSGSGFAPPNSFSDGGLAGDASSPPSTTVGATAGNALAVLDMITDGVSIYVAVLDLVGTDPNPVGRLLQFFPVTALWTQIGLAFPIAAGNGIPAALSLFDGAITYGNYVGIAAGNTSYVTGTGNPLPSGGITEIHTTTASVAPTCLASYNGELYIGTTCLTTTAAVVLKRSAAAVWSTSLTAGAAAAKNAYTTLSVFNGRLFAGWTSGGGATAANIYSTPDGVNWTLEKAFGVGDVPCQMVTFNGNLYVVLGTTGIAYNNTSSVWQRTAAGAWTQVDAPADAFAGCLALVYK